MNVLVSSDITDLLQGAKEVKEELELEINKLGLSDEIAVVETGNLGFANKGVVIYVLPDNVYYGFMTPERARIVVNEHFYKGRVVKDFVISDTLKDNNKIEYAINKTTLPKQKRVVLRGCGMLNPDDIEEYIAFDGYEALVKAITEYTPEDIIKIIKDSGLRGRGGAGFPTGMKWEFTANVKKSPKYVVCNADEGEPGTFKDRLIMEGNPHLIIEGMAIAAFAIGAEKGYVYIRGEYAQSIEKLQRAIDQAKMIGFLGNDILGKGFNFDIEIVTGAGAYVCGEETALLNSMEGKRGNPRVKPPYPNTAGFNNQPTLVNNVETLANVPWIINNGADEYRKIGTESTPGTKVFTLLGSVNNTGLIEVPMGITLKEIIEIYGGGMKKGRAFKAAQTGGTSGGIIPRALWEVPMEYDSLAKVGTALGSGALLIMDDTVEIPDMLLSMMKFFRHESCGKCTPCRVGTDVLVRLLEKVVNKEASKEDVDLLLSTSEVMNKTCLCALGQSPYIPINTSIKYFHHEFV